MRLVNLRHFIVATLVAGTLASSAYSQNTTEGEAIYHSVCFSCHGKNLEGATGPKLTDGTWLHGASDEQLLASLSNGFLEKGMPGFKGVYSEAALNSVVEYIKSKRQGFTDLNYKVYENVSEDAFSFEDVAELRVSSEGSLRDGIINSTLPEIESYAMYFEGTLLAPNEETRLLEINAGWRNEIRVRIDGREFDGKLAMSTILKAGQKFELLFLRRNPRTDLRIELTGDNEIEPLSTASVAHSRKTELFLTAKDQPFVVRKSIDRIPNKSIAVGFPDLLSYAYHAPTGSIVGVWKGGSLNIGPNVIGRGQESSRPVDRWIFADDRGLTISIDGKEREFKLQEYTRGNSPTFYSQSGKYQLKLSALPISQSLLNVSYTLSGKRPKSVSIHIPDGLRVTSEDGQFSGDQLVMSPSALTSFSLNISE